MQRKSPPALLEYSPPPPWHRRIWMPRALILISLLLAATLVWRGRLTIWRQAQLVYWQSKCLAYTAPATSQANFIPEAWDHFYAIFSPPGLQSSGTAFVHERTAPNGNRRLVAVDAGAVSLGVSKDGVFFVARVFTPGSLVRPPIETPIGFEQIRMPAGPGTHILAGQIDQTDPSHFTFEVETPGSAGLKSTSIIDGWLRNDDSVLLELRSTSATNSNPEAR